MNYLLLSSIICSICLNYNFFLSDKKVQLKDYVIIGNNENAGEEYLLTSPRFISTDKKNNIYILEGAVLTIRKYDKNGKFIKNIGRRGKGPGEFQKFSAFCITRGDTLIIVDDLMKRVTLLSVEGKLLGTINYDNRLMELPRKIIEYKNKYYAVLSNDVTSKCLVHILAKSFKKKYSCIDIKLKSHTNEGVDNFGIELGQLYVTNDEALIFTPYLYDGSLIKVKKIGKNNWGNQSNIEGYVEIKEPYTLVSDEEDDNINDPPYSVKGTFHGVKHAAVFHNESRGIYQLNNGELLHFTVIEKDNNKIFGVERYDRKYRLLGYYEITKKKLRYKKPTYLNLSILWKDSEDFFYMVDAEKFPIIRKMKLFFD